MPEHWVRLRTVPESCCVRVPLKAEDSAKILLLRKAVCVFCWVGPDRTPVLRENVPWSRSWSSEKKTTPEPGLMLGFPVELSIWEWSSRLLTNVIGISDSTMSYFYMCFCFHQHWRLFFLLEPCHHTSKIITKVVTAIIRIRKPTKTMSPGRSRVKKKPNQSRGLTQCF